MFAKFALIAANFDFKSSVVARPPVALASPALFDFINRFVEVFILLTGFWPPVSPCAGSLESPNCWFY